MHDNTNYQEITRNYFNNENQLLSMENDSKFHGKSYLMSLALLREEIDNIIDPNLHSPNLSEEVKSYLAAKKNDLNKFQAVRI